MTLTEPRMLSGWGRATATRSDVAVSGRRADLPSFLAAAPARGVLARGSGSSYGDAAQNAGGLVIDVTAMREIDDTAVDEGIVTAEAGATMEDVVLRTLPRGWTLPVVPGTRFVSVGGAIASDIHGKSHHHDGSWSRHTRSLRLLTSAGEHLSVDHATTREAFDATMGGMGLTGVVVDATLELIPVETAWMTVSPEVTRGLDETVERLHDSESRARYCIAWLDLLAPAGRTGRAVIDFGDHARLEELPPKHRGVPLAAAARRRRTAPAIVPSVRAVNRTAIGAFNALWYARASRRRAPRLEPLDSFFWPLDAVPGWNRLYGPRGFVQYQFVVPPHATGVLAQVIERLGRSPACPALATLKRLGEQADGPLGFAQAGWTLAVDLPVGTPGLATLLDGLDELVANARGRVYLTKDARLRPDVLSAMYPRLDEWREARSRLDPQGAMQSDLARRLSLT